MNVVTTIPPAACRDVVPPHPDEPTAPRTRGDRQPTIPGAADLLLVFGTVAMVLGLAAVTASLTPETAGVGDLQRNWAPIGIDRDLASVAPPDIAEHYLAEPPATPMDVAGDPDRGGAAAIQCGRSLAVAALSAESRHAVGSHPGQSAT